jgi:hypothetical protein
VESVSAQHEGGPGQPAGAAEIPSVVTPLTREQILDRLGNMSKRGKLPGFVRVGVSGPVLFRAEAFGEPFEGVLEARAEGDSATTLRFAYRMLPKLPWIFGVVSLLTIWPGVILTDSLMKTYFPGFTASVPTSWWYLPLTVLPLPLMWRSWMRKSRTLGMASAQEQAAKIAAELATPGR